MRQAAPPPAVHVRRANPWVVVAIAGGAGLIAVVVMLALSLTGSKSSPAAVAPLPGARAATTLYRGIPQHGLVLGSPKARVRMVAYVDLQCPICRNFEATAMPDLVDRYVRTGKVQLELRPWAFIGPDSTRAQAALFAASEQNRAFQFAQVLYANQGEENTGWLTDDMIRRIAVSVPGLDVSRLFSDRGGHEADAASVAKSALRNGVTGTPSVFVDSQLVGAPGSAPTGPEVAQAIETALRS